MAEKKICPKCGKKLRHCVCENDFAELIEDEYVCDYCGENRDDCQCGK